MSDQATDLVVGDKPQPLAAPASETANLMLVLERVATNPDADTDKMLTVMDMMERAQDRAAAQAYNESMMAAQNQMPAIKKNKRNQQTRSNYADLCAVTEQAKPIYTRHGFSLSFGEGVSDKPEMIRIIADCMHQAGHTKQYYIDLPIDNKGIQGKVNKTDTHAISSTNSYGKRILKCNIFDIATGDDVDGNSPVAEALFITDKQVQEVYDFIGAQPDRDFEERLLQYLQGKGITSVAEIPAKQYSKFMEAFRKAASNGNS